MTKFSNQPTTTTVTGGNNMTIRTAIVQQNRYNEITLERVQAYMPSNYTVEVQPELHDEGDQLVITGHDSAGWTLDGYVLPRLASGNIYAREVV